jgi:hypothetical protein
MLAGLDCQAYRTTEQDAFIGVLVSFLPTLAPCLVIIVTQEGQFPMLFRPYLGTLVLHAARRRL